MPITALRTSKTYNSRKCICVKGKLDELCMSHAYMGVSKNHVPGNSSALVTGTLGN